MIPIQTNPQPTKERTPFSVILIIILLTAIVILLLTLLVRGGFLGNKHNNRDKTSEIFTETQSDSDDIDKTPIPDFSDYPVNATSFKAADHFAGVSPTEESHLFNFRIGLEIFDQAPDFAGYYKTTVIGCGTHCGSGAIVDLRDGEVYYTDLDFVGYTEVYSNLYVHVALYDDYINKSVFKDKESVVTSILWNESTKKFSNLSTLYCDVDETITRQDNFSRYTNCFE